MHINHCKKRYIEIKLMILKNKHKTQIVLYIRTFRTNRIYNKLLISYIKLQIYFFISIKIVNKYIIINKNKIKFYKIL